MAGKEAVVFILDANLTMNAPYPSEVKDIPAGDGNGSTKQPSPSSTRLSQAKDAILDSIVDLMWTSKTNETGVVVLKTGVTHHHLSEIERIVDDASIGKFFRRCGGGIKLNRYDNGSDEEDNDVFSNLVEFELNRPNPSTLRAMSQIQCTINEQISSSVQGDLCDGLILAADSLHRRTAGKKYKRKIVMITDAEHEVEVNGEQLQCVLDGLKKMEVELIVVGIGFKESVDIAIKKEESLSDTDDAGAIDLCSEDDEALAKKPESAPMSESDEANSNNDNNDQTMIKEEGNPDEMMIDDTTMKQKGVDMGLLIKRENEKLLLSIAKETGGSILASNSATLSEVLQTKLPCRAGMTKWTMKNMEFRIAPSITLPVKSAKLISKKNLPTTIKDAYLIDPKSGEPMRDGAGDLMTSKTKTRTDHYEDEESEVTVSLVERTDAFRYGSDLIPVGKMDMLGINAAFADSPSIEIIGYIDKSVIENSNLLMGPAYAFTGGDSKKARSAIAALSQALDEMNMVGYCRIVRMKNGEPRVGALLPKLEGSDDRSYGPNTRGKGGRYLAFLELPFADDLQHQADIHISLEWHGDFKDEKVCDDLIDSMMLPDDELQSEEIPYPALKAHHHMIANLAMNPLSHEEEMDKEGLAEGRILEASQAKPLCEFDAVKAITKTASEQIDAFVDTYPLMENRPEDDKKTRHWGGTLGM